MNSKQEKTVTLVITKSDRRAVVIVPETRLADLRATLDLPDGCNFSLTANGPALSPNALVFDQVIHRGRLYVLRRRMEQLTFGFDEPGARGQSQDPTLVETVGPTGQDGASP